MAIKRKFPRIPSEVLWCGVSFMQRWKCLLKGEERTKAEVVTADDNMAQEFYSIQCFII